MLSCVSREIVCYDCMYHTCYSLQHHDTTHTHTYTTHTHTQTKTNKHIHTQVCIMLADQQFVWLVHEGGLLAVWSAEDRMLLCEPIKCFNSDITYVGGV